METQLFVADDYKNAVAFCVSEFEAKHTKYGPSWTILRLQSLMDQVFIKLQRVRTIQEKRTQFVDDPMETEFNGIFNYCIFAKINIKNQMSGKSFKEAYEGDPLAFYQEAAADVERLHAKKNHDYGDAWRDMRLSSLVDLSLMKTLRFMQIYQQDSRPEHEKFGDYDELFSDIANYAIFSQIRIAEGINPMF